MVNSPGRHNICKIYSLYIKTPKYMKQKLTELRGEIDNSIIVVGELYLIYTGHSPQQENTTQQQDCIWDIFQDRP